MTRTMAIQTEFPQQVMFKRKCMCVIVENWFRHAGREYRHLSDISLRPLFSRQARSTDNLDSSGEPATRSIGTTANLRGKMSKR